MYAHARACVCVEYVYIHTYIHIRNTGNLLCLMLCYCGFQPLLSLWIEKYKRRQKKKKTESTGDRSKKLNTPRPLKFLMR